MATLSTSRQLMASLISSISAAGLTPNDVQNLNPLRDAPKFTQKALLTLHVTFPNELLPALDLLDRGLVTRFKLNRDDATRQPKALHAGLRHPPAEGDTAQNDGRASVGFPALAEHGGRTTKVYYVRSGQSQPRHRAAVNHTTSYEVRLDAWSCSCPAFAFSAFPASAPVPSGNSDCGVIDEQANDFRAASWSFGGLTLGTDMSVCKHMLACLLVEHCSIFAGFVEEREISVEELAGWAAGWGD